MKRQDIYCAVFGFWELCTTINWGAGVCMPGCVSSLPYRVQDWQPHQMRITGTYIVANANGEGPPPVVSFDPSEYG